MQPVTPGATHYDRRTIWLHWLTALLVLSQWFGAQTIDWFPRGPLRVDARSVHITLGLTLLAIYALRIVWRATEGRRLPAADRGALHVVAKATHWGMYALLACVLALGVFNVWVRGDSIFNLFSIPAYSPDDKALRSFVEDWHGTLATTVLILAGIHAGAALVHRYLWHDGVLARMLPGRG
jgi:cytochrome b561